MAHNESLIKKAYGQPDTNKKDNIVGENPTIKILSIKDNNNNHEKSLCINDNSNNNDKNTENILSQNNQKGSKFNNFIDEKLSILNILNTITDFKRYLIYGNCLVNNRETKYLCDPGADLCVCKYDFHLKLSNRCARTKRTTQHPHLWERLKNG